MQNTQPASSTKQRPSRRQASSSAREAARLSGYLAAGVGAGLVCTSQSDASVVPIDIGPTGFNINGANGGAPSSVNSFTTVSNFPIAGAGDLVIKNYYGGFFSGQWGFGGSNGLTMATNPVSLNSPTKLSVSQTVDALLTFSGDSANWKSMFQINGLAYGGNPVPSWGAGSYMGFKTAQNNYGWLEATWDATSRQFRAISGAYESVPNTPITIQAVPEPSTMALTGAAALAMGSGAIRRARRSLSR